MKPSAKTNMLTSTKRHAQLTDHTHTHTHTHPLSPALSLFFPSLSLSRTRARARSLARLRAYSLAVSLSLSSFCESAHARSYLTKTASANAAMMKNTSCCGRRRKHTVMGVIYARTHTHTHACHTNAHANVDVKTKGHGFSRRVRHVRIGDLIHSFIRATRLLICEIQR